MHSIISTAFITALLSATPLVTGLGINCRGSGLCHLASWENKAPEPVMQVLRDAIWQSSKSNDTTYNTGEHIICIAGRQTITLTGTGTYNTPETEGGSGALGGSFSLSGGINTGGICLFAQGLSAPNINLGSIRSLIDKLLEHGCGTCGSVPVHFIDQGSNDPKGGILTFNYVHDPFCTGNCISGQGTSGTTTSPQANASSSLIPSAKFAALKDKA